MTTPSTLEAEHIAMNIVHQIGDVLYDALPKDIAHKYFVTARQATNDIAIDFATTLITKRELERAISELEMIYVIRDDLMREKLTQRTATLTHELERLK